MTRVRTFVCLLTAGTLLSLPATADTLEQIEKKLTDAYKNLKSYTAKIKSTQDMSFGEGMSMKSETKGTIEWMRKGDKYLYRVEQKGTSVQNMGGQETKSKTMTTIVGDEQFVHTLQDRDGTKTAYKSKADHTQSNDPASMFKMLRDSYELSVLDDEKVDGQDCFVIEAKAKDPASSPVMRQVYYFRKSDGINAKMAGFDASGKQTMLTLTTDIKTNVDIDADRFRFEAPEGVEVMDMTNQGP